MKKIWFIVIIAASALVLGCKDEKKSAESANQMQEVMAIHDEVMPRMSTIGKLVGELKPMVDSTATGQAYEKAMKDLQASHKAMMDWMQGFGNRFDSEEIMEGKALSEEKQKWLDEEEQKVRALREQIENSIAQAEALLNN